MMDAIDILKGLLFVSILFYAAIYDAKTLTIPDRTHILLIFISFIGGFTWDNFWGFILVPLPFLVVAFMGKMGGGDVKLLAGIGAVMGVSCGLTAAILAQITFFLYYRFVRGKKTGTYPFGPFLAGGAVLVYLCKELI